MSVRLTLKGLKPGLDSAGYLIDLFMISLVVLNLAWLTFDWLFAYASINDYLSETTPGFYQFYLPIHDNFLRYDLMFVAIYLTEFFIRWIIAVARSTYHRWFFYPFIHWYDLIGCIPVGGFRWLRLLRIISLLYRLERRGIIDLSDTPPGRFITKYYGVLVEELSDRVVLNVLDGVEREIKENNPLVKRIQSEVLQPRKKALVDYLTKRIIHATEKTHQDYREPLANYLAVLVEHSLANTRNGKRLAAMPVAGPRAITLIRESVEELSMSLTDQLVLDIQNPANRENIDQLLTDLLENATGTDDRLDTLVRSTLLDILNQVKQQVAVQQWKLNEARKMQN